MIQHIFTIQFFLGAVVGFGVGMVVVGKAARRQERLFRRDAVRQAVAAELVRHEVDPSGMETDPAPETTSSPAGFEHDPADDQPRQTTPYVAPSLH